MKNLTEYINESMDYNPNPNNWPNVETLGIGEFDGALWGHCFVYENTKYFSDNGWLNMFPSYCKMKINEEGAFPHPIDEYQRESLKKLFN